MSVKAPPWSLAGPSRLRRVPASMRADRPYLLKNVFAYSEHVGHFARLVEDDVNVILKREATIVDADAFQECSVQGRCAT